MQVVTRMNTVSWKYCSTWCLFGTSRLQ